MTRETLRTLAMIEQCGRRQEICAPPTWIDDLDHMQALWYLGVDDEIPMRR